MTQQVYIKDYIKSYSHIKGYLQKLFQLFEERQI